MINLNLVVNDSGWQYTNYANPMRGWHDYVRTIKVNKELSQEEIKEWVDYLDKEKGCPAGQGRPLFNSQAKSTNDNFVLKFSCFLDSSD